jgi:hypothetical protein
MRRCLGIFSVYLLLLPFPAQCWWEEGHQVIARIAVRHLTPAALARVSEILEVDNTPESIANAMAAASVWADQVKTDTGTGNWHFLNLTLQDSRSNMAERCPEDDCATARIGLFAAQLKANDPDADSAWSDQDALRFLIHLVGDLHQPLHAISDADEGGNCELLDEPVEQAKNLHAVWDGPLVSRMGADDTALAAQLDTEIAALSDDQRSDFSSGDQNDWAWESHRLAIGNIYKRLHIPKQDIAFPDTCAQAPDEIRELHIQIDEDYLDAMQPIVRDQLKKAGLRLAALLNEILG